MLRKLRRVPRSVWLHGRIAAFLMVFPVLVRTFPIQRVVDVLTPRPTQVRPTRPRPDVERVQWAVDRLYMRRPLRSYGPCLRRTLTLYYFVTRLGYPVKVALGAYVRDGQLQAHAWLTLDGQPFLERGTVEQYAVMAEWPREQDRPHGAVAA